MHHGNSKNPPLIVAFMLSNCESMTMSTTYQLQRTHNLIPTESYCHPGFFILEINTLCSLDRFCGMVDVYNYIIRVVNILTFIFLIIRARKITVISSHQFQQMAARLDTGKKPHRDNRSESISI